MAEQHPLAAVWIQAGGAERLNRTDITIERATGRPALGSGHNRPPVAAAISNPTEAPPVLQRVLQMGGIVAKQAALITRNLCSMPALLSPVPAPTKQGGRPCPGRATGQRAGAVLLPIPFRAPINRSALSNGQYRFAADADGLQTVVSRSFAAGARQQFAVPGAIKRCFDVRQGPNGTARPGPMEPSTWRQNAGRATQIAGTALGRNCAAFRRSTACGKARRPFSCNQTTPMGQQQTKS